MNTAATSLMLLDVACHSPLPFSTGEHPMYMNAAATSIMLLDVACVVEISSIYQIMGANHTQVRVSYQSPSSII